MDIMSIKDISPDAVTLWQWGPLKLNLTILYTWIVMAGLVLIAVISTRNLRTGGKIGKLQNLMEMTVSFMRKQIGDVAHENPDKYLTFVGTIFLFIAVSNILAVVPGFIPPTGSLSTTSALALAVFVAVPVYGIFNLGAAGYFRQYVKPSALMLPFNIIGELSRTLALAVRLFGNMMSGTKIVAILLVVAPFIFPVLMNALGLLTGILQAYIFAILAIVYIASSARARKETQQKVKEKAEARG